MSALIYIYSTQGIILSADTLSVSLDKTPQVYVSKILPVPHLKTVICGTGFKPIIAKWYGMAMENIIGFDISALNHHAPEKLNTLLLENKEAVTGTTTIFHFGWSHESNTLKGYAFRSESDFALEELENGTIGIKPGHPGVNELYASFSQQYSADSRFFHIEMIKGLKALDDALPMTGRVCIGGEIQWLNLSGNGDMSMATIYQFPDFGDLYLRMLGVS